MEVLLLLNEPTEPSRSQRSLLMIDHLRVCVAECVMAFSELEETVDKL